MEGHIEHPSSDEVMFDIESDQLNTRKAKMHKWVYINWELGQPIKQLVYTTPTEKLDRENVGLIN